MKELQELRNRIDEIDSKLIEIFEERMKVVSEVGRVKRENGIGTLNEKREEEVIERGRSLVKDKTYEESTISMLKSIMAISRSHQNSSNCRDKIDAIDKIMDSVVEKKDKPRVVYQGVEGAFSFEALKQFSSDCSYTNVDNFRDVFEALENGECDYGILPIENSSTGAINDVYDLMREYKTYIVGEELVKIEQCLFGVEGAKIEDIKEIYSHPQGFSQSSNFLSQYGDIRLMPYNNTAMAAKMVSEEKNISKAAICSKAAGEIYGLKCIKEGINNLTNNYTRFIIVGKNLECDDQCNKVSVILTLPHVSGSLYETLAHFANNGLNMLKIESRPTGDKAFEYFFYIDFTGNLDDGVTRKVIEDLACESIDFRLIGCYKQSCDMIK